MSSWDPACGGTREGSRSLFSGCTLLRARLGAAAARLARPRLAAAALRCAGTLRPLDRLAQRLHQVDHLRLALLGLRKLLALRLRLDQLEQLLAVVVVVLLRLELLAQVLHERRRHLHLGLA